jgi:hypothetical protein
VRAWCVAVAEEQVTAIEAAGYDVVGTLDDLRCFESAFDSGDPAPDEAEVAAAAVAALGAVLTQRAEATLRRRSAGGDGGGLRGRLKRLAGGGRTTGATPDDLDDEEP